MAKRINIKKARDVNVSTNIEDSEIQSEAIEGLGDLDMDIGEAQDVDGSTNIKGSKVKKGWLYVVLAIIAAAVTIAGYYFSQQ